MKKTLFVLIMLAIYSVVNAQKCAEKFFAISSYGGYPANLGIEAGTWPGYNNSFGYLGGIQADFINTTVIDPQKGAVKTTVMETQFFFKTIYRFSRYIYGTAGVGLYDFDQLIPTAGLRAVFPIDNGRYALWAEPNVSTNGFKINVALSIPLD